MHYPQGIPQKMFSCISGISSSEICFIVKTRLQPYMQTPNPPQTHPQRFPLAAGQAVFGVKVRVEVRKSSAIVKGC